MIERTDALRKVLKEHGIDALLITKDENQRYLEGYTGSECYLLFTSKESFLIADSRYIEMAQADCRRAKIVPHRDPHPPFCEVIAKLCADVGIKCLGFEGNISYTQYEAVRLQAEKFGIELVPTSGLVEDIRTVKDESEIACLRRACEIADRALENLFPKIKPGVSERELVAALEYLVGKEADGASFDSMVLFGARSSRPHAVPLQDVKLCVGDLVLIDYGVKFQGYRSDTTRTFVCGKATPEQKRRYEAVLRSQIEGVEAARDGAESSLPDKVSRDILIGEEGCFSTGVGHGVGLEIHENPFMRHNSAGVLSAGMVLTVEPGIYVPGWGGIRIEDTVLVTKGEPEILTKFPKKELKEVGL